MPLSPKDIPLIKVYGTDFRYEVAVMYNVCESLNLVDWLRNTDPISITHPNIERILRHPDVDSCGHSGATETACLSFVVTIIQKGLQSLNSS